MRTLSLDAARRIAVRATRLDTPRPKSILDVVRQTGPLQLDPTSAVARSELLVLWSRLGRYAVGKLDRLLWEERALFTWRAFLYPVEDWPLVAAAGSGFPDYDGIASWLRDNKPFERYVLATLKREGPTPQSELEDRSVRPWESTGWTHGKNVSQLLEFLWAQGKVLVTARRGQERVWDLAERVVPHAPKLQPRDAALAHLEQRFRQLGPMTEAGYKRVPMLRGLPPHADAFARLVRDGVLVAHEIDGVRGTWYVHRDLIEPARPFRGRRTTLLSPFDPLVYDRTRAKELWSFRYKLEIYVPAAKREFGYFVLPILHRDQLVGRIDPLFDRKGGVLRVKQVYAEESATADAGAAIAKAIHELARWLGASNVDVGRIPRVWRSDLG